MSIVLEVEFQKLGFFGSFGSGVPKVEGEWECWE
jgi:hypothetical protein